MTADPQSPEMQKTRPQRRTQIVRVAWGIASLSLALDALVDRTPSRMLVALVGLALAVIFFCVAMVGISLIERHSPLAAGWLIVAPTSCLIAFGLLDPKSLVPILLANMLSALTGFLFFRPRTAWLNNLVLASAFLLLNWQQPIPGLIAFLASLAILALLVAQLRQSESELVQEIASHTADMDAITTISWSLTSLAPDPQAVETILRRVCPPDVSLGLLQCEEETKTIVTIAAVGDEAEALHKWRYVLRPESASMVAEALRQRRILAASTHSDSAPLLLIGALPSTRGPLRSAAAMPLMVQSEDPLGVLLAISSSPEGVGDARQLGVLPAVANHLAIALENARLFTQVQARADHDAMTGLYHHRALLARLSEEILRANRSGSLFAVLMMDLDRFKLFNETYGHQVGDRILLRVAAALPRSLRATDILGRYGGDEFLAILPDTDSIEARQIAQAAVEAIAAEIFRPNENAERMPLTLSVGIASFPHDGHTTLELLGSAEAAMNDAKHNGGNSWRDMATQENLPHRVVDLRSFSVLEALVTAVDHKDRYTKAHSEEVSIYAELLAREINLPESRRAVLFDAGLLHDVGKVGVPDAVLQKPGRLTDAEMEAMKQHVVLSEALLRCLLPPDTDPDLIEAVRYHHERWDGRGYPRGLAGEDVPLIGRIMIVADAVSAMHTDRPYRRGLSIAQIVGELRRGKGTQFDPDLVEPFIAAFLRHYGLSEADLLAQAAEPPTRAQSIERLAPIEADVA
jgi:diguanylate cyclase (GGDEF)-like protein